MKRLLCFIGELNVEFQNELTQYISDHAAEHDCRITFMVNFDTRGDNFMYGELEKKIITIPDLDRYDGIIICPDTFSIAGMIEDLSDYLHENAKCPVVSLRVQDDRFYSIVLGDYEGICGMVDHFILVHKMTRICFMTGRMDLKDAHVRLKAYRDTMEKHGLEVTEKMIFYGDYWLDKGEDAVEWFLTQNEEMPEAIVCSNDYMAIAVCKALRKRGIVVPDQICVSGLDDISDVKYHIPSITSIMASIPSMCDLAFETLNRIWSGEQKENVIALPLEPVYRNSSGCTRGIDENLLNTLYNEKEKYLSALNFSPYINLHFDSTDEIDELISSIRGKLAQYNGGRNFADGVAYLCLCDESERAVSNVEKNLEYTEKMYLRAIITSENLERCSYLFSRGEIIPERFRKQDSPLFLFTLHGRDHCYGYLVLQNRDITNFITLIKPLIFSLGSSLDRISRIKLFEDLRDQTYIDELTGIPNRRSMERFIRRMRDDMSFGDHMLCIMSLDMDGLKYINDTFGHREGDFSIKTAANVINSLRPENGIAARTGGDEFVVMFLSDAEVDALGYIEKLNARVKEVNESWNKPYPLSISYGYEYCRKDQDMLMCMHKADNKMYACKKAKHHERGKAINK